MQDHADYESPPGYDRDPLALPPGALYHVHP
jgi:hypothetical protein